MMKLSLFLGVLVTTTSAVSAKDVTLVANGTPQVCVVAAEAVLAVDPDQASADRDLVLLRWAAEDLTNYLAQISGAAVPLGAQPAAGLIPIYVGNPPARLPMTAKSEFGDAYLIDVGDKQ
ncbi:hypothetical protein HQ590_16405, partial [bacterium]|nr:hypothetical protein [bacterium]